MTSYRYIVFDVLTTLKKDNASSDISEQQMLFWAVTLANVLRQQRIVKAPTGRYLNIFTGIPVQKVGTSANPNVVKNRQLIVLPASVYDIMNERGIDYICHSQDASCPPEFMNLYFQPTSPSRAQRLTFSPYEKPSAKNPYFYRVENIIYFLGMESTIFRSVELGLYTSINMKTNLLSLDDEIDLVEEHIDILRKQLLQLGGFALAVPKDRVNDASNSQESAIKPPQQVEQK